MVVYTVIPHLGDSGVQGPPGRQSETLSQVYKHKIHYTHKKKKLEYFNTLVMNYAKRKVRKRIHLHQNCKEQNAGGP
jgi:hypothetical protein